MTYLSHDIDVRESILHRKGNLLKILLRDRSTAQNIIWATDSYQHLGGGFAPRKEILPELITGEYHQLIQPRAVKPQEEQRQRTKDKAEVFTPLAIVGKINRAAEKNGLPRKRNWQKYVQELRLEITCGEAPFIVTRYDPTAQAGELVPIRKRVGFLDRKMRTVSKYCDTKSEWLVWAKEAFKASYGYDWQGDNVLLARENLLYTLIDYYQDKFGKTPALQMQEEFAEIISWNIFQMDGLKYVVPMSCHSESKVIPGERTLFEYTPDTLVEYKCLGCANGDPRQHNGQYVKIMDWKDDRTLRFVEMIRKRAT